MRSSTIFCATLIAFVIARAGPAGAWGSTGHGFISSVAIEALGRTGEGVPDFVRTQEAIALITELSREPDRSRGAGRIHGEERDPGHYVNLDEDGTVFGVVPLSNIARTRADYDTALRARGVSQYQVGYLPYAIVDGWQQLVKDFAYWRALTAVITAPDTTPERKAWALADRKNREILTLRDLGVWSHYVGDASQPLHASRHFDGWGPYSNPRSFSQEAGLHWRIEGPFVRLAATRAAVAEGVRPYRACACPFEVRVANYLMATRSFVGQTYELEAAGAFAVPKPGTTGAPPPSPQGTAFVTERLAAGASELRDMIEDAWTQSLDARVGYPEVSLRAIVKNPAIVTPEAFGVD